MLTLSTPWIAKFTFYRSACQVHLLSPIVTKQGNGMTWSAKCSPIHSSMGHCQIVLYPIHPPCTPWDCYHLCCAKPPSHVLCTNTGYLTQLGFLRNSYSLFTGHSGYRSNQSSFTYAMMLILAGDIESNPRPHHAVDSRWPAQTEWGGIYPCAFCDLLVDWSDLAVQCDECDVWHHKSCIEMPTCEYDHIENVPWKCYKWKSTNCSSFLYQAYNRNVSNSFDALAGIPGDDSVFANIVSPSRFPKNLNSQVLPPVTLHQV